MKRLSVLGVMSVVLAVGCQQPAQRLNSPPQGDTVNRSPLQEPFHAMVDNSVLADMSVADIHFAGSTPQLSGTGEYRLSKLAQVCKVYGGEIRYDTQLQNDKLLQDRLKRVEQYLAAAGLRHGQVLRPAWDGCHRRHARRTGHQGPAGRLARRRGEQQRRQAGPGAQTSRRGRGRSQQVRHTMNRIRIVPWGSGLPGSALRLC